MTFGKKIVENFRKVAAAPKKEAPGSTPAPTFRQVGKSGSPASDAEVKHNS